MEVSVLRVSAIKKSHMKAAPQNCKTNYLVKPEWYLYLTYCSFAGSPYALLRNKLVYTLHQRGRKRSLLFNKSSGI